MIKQLLWDWNGTLLNDVQYAIGVRNRTFPSYGLSRIETMEEYYNLFTFPVAEYYRRSGVTDDIFDEIAHAWMAEYVRDFAEVTLFEDAVSALQLVKEAGIKQTVLSATKLDMLKEQVSQFSIQHYFETLLGLSDIYARSKEEIGLQYLHGCGIAPQNTCIIGDTLHDAEVAGSMNIHCLLVARGHQSRETLQSSGYSVCDNLTEAVNRLLQM